MWFQYDGSPAHHSLVARGVLDRDYNPRWIGRVHCLGLQDRLISLWGYLKNEVHIHVPTMRENMIERIINVCLKITPDILLSCVQSFETRVQKCIEEKGCI